MFGCAARPFLAEPDQIVAWVQAFKNVEDRAKVVSLAEIQAEERWPLSRRRSRKRAQPRAGSAKCSRPEDG